MATLCTDCCAKRTRDDVDKQLYNMKMGISDSDDRRTMDYKLRIRMKTTITEWHIPDFQRPIKFRSKQGYLVILFVYDSQGGGTEFQWIRQLSSSITGHFL